MTLEMDFIPHDEHTAFLSAAIALASSARKNGNHPFGAVLVLNGSVLLRAENTVSTLNDATNHAEMNLVRQATQALSPNERELAILYTSTESCVMCAGAIYWSGIRTVVFACSVATLAKHATGSFAVPCQEIFSRGRFPTRAIGPLLEAEAERDHASFWKQKLR